MSEQECKSYRFNDRIDPTDKQLAELMRQAAEDAREKGSIAYDKFFDELHNACEDAKQHSRSNS